MQTDPIGYEDGMNWYAYVGNDPINGVDPDGKVSVSIGLDFEAILPVGGGGQPGVFVNYDKGVITLGTFTETKVSAGEDVGVSVSIQGAGGGLSDFEGRSVTVEADYGLLTVEPGTTLDAQGMPSQPIFGVEFGPGLPAGGSANVIDTTIQDKISIDITPVIDVLEKVID